MIQEKLQTARVKLQEMKLKKSGKNKFAGFTYYELADFLPAINKLFLELKLSSNFSIMDGMASLTITDWEDNTNEEFTSPIETLELKGCTRIQALGGIHTYLKRYLYLNALEIVENDMLDPNVGNNGTLEELDPDTDLLLGLQATVSTDEALRYYRANESNAKNATAFKNEYMKHYSKLKLKENKNNG